MGSAPHPSERTCGVLSAGERQTGWRRGCGGTLEKELQEQCICRSLSRAEEQIPAPQQCPTDLTPVPAPPPKRPRLTRAVSGPATVSATPTQITLPLNQLAGLPLGKVLTVAGSPAGTNLGGYTLLTSTLSGSELVADSSNLTLLSTAAGQEGTTAPSAPQPTAFAKVVGPQFQLLTLPATLQNLATTQSTAVQQQVGSISVVDATATTDDSQDERQADGDDEAQPEQVKEEDESAEQQ
ncbi:glucocorticoid modulatory element-binding protein 2 isoform X1 [Lates japonicus]|uniref:Glucocorticoid modulatory element-binding protein 2 isoform X1 n=1 Tax=Lates japonicus TaxID=270547 RepID=A0AAD3NF32_LATJO|nr:glucocorticoid modulatory element-binding protein 2 isoform X1 [Lates japonicus]